MRRLLLFIVLFINCLSLCSACTKEVVYKSVEVTIEDLANREGKWDVESKGGLFLLKGGETVLANINLGVTIKDAHSGLFSTALYNLKRDEEYGTLLYTPYRSGYDLLRDKNLSLSLPSSQNQSTRALTLGKSSFKLNSKNAKSLSLKSEQREISGEVVINLSNSNSNLQGWRVLSLTLYAPEKSAISGELLLNIENGEVKGGESGRSNFISYSFGNGALLNSTALKIALKALPAKLNGESCRIEYTLQNQSEEITICHNINSFVGDILSGEKLTLNETIPPILAGEWYISRYPGLQWDNASPESVGFSSAKLELLRSWIEKNRTTSHMMVIVNGKVIFTMGEPSNDSKKIASCRKSLLSMLYGKYVEEGTINLNKTLEELGIDDIGGLLAIEKRATIANLLTARSGCFHPASNTGDDSAYAPSRGSVEPGSYFLYNNWDFNCAGYIFEMLTGATIYEKFRDDIASQIGMQDYTIGKQSKTGDLTISKYPAYHFWLSVRDMARVGYLMLRKGNWNGKRVISEEWIDRTTSLFTPRAEMNPESRHTAQFDYGYLWWIFSKEYTGYIPEIYEGGYTATGLGGQYISILPALDMVISHKDDSGNYTKSQYYDLIRRIGECKL